MEKAEKIFSIVIILAYIILSIILKIPLYAHLMFGTIILGLLVIVLILKLEHKYENEKISNIFKIISILMVIWFFISITYESFYNASLLIDSTIILMLIYVTYIIRWIFGRKNNE